MDKDISHIITKIRELKKACKPGSNFVCISFSELLDWENILDTTPPPRSTEAPKVLDYLNNKLRLKGKRKYRQTKGNLSLITARLREGYSVEDLNSVIDDRYAHWGQDEKMRKYIRPSTLFSKSNFSNYYSGIRVLKKSLLEATMERLRNGRD